MNNIFLWLMGWSWTPGNLFSYMEKNKRIVAVYPHTSYWDFFVCLLFVMTFPKNLRQRVCILMDPRFLRLPVIGSFLGSIGCIPSSSLEKRNQGQLQHIVDELMKKDSFFLFISPKGTRAKREWRTGWFYIARWTRAKRITVGVDYIKHEGVYKTDKAFIELDYSEYKRKVEESMSDIIPLNTELSEIPLKYNYIGEPCVINEERKIILLGICVLVPLAMLTLF